MFHSPTHKRIHTKLSRYQSRFNFFVFLFFVSFDVLLSKNSYSVPHFLHRLSPSSIFFLFAIILGVKWTRAVCYPIIVSHKLRPWQPRLCELNQYSCSEYTDTKFTNSVVKCSFKVKCSFSKNCYLFQNTPDLLLVRHTCSPSPDSRHWSVLPSPLNRQ